MMFKAVASVRDEVLKRCNGGEITLEAITKVFAGLTIVDVIVFVPFDTPPDNPIWGQFTRWSRSPSVYASSETVVEIRYAKHLSEEWRRMIVCKELCHSLEASAGAHDVSQAGIDTLVNSFSALSASEFDGEKLGVGMALEILAEMAAIELLCPLEQRKRIIGEAGQPDALGVKRLAKEFKIPLEFATLAFDPKQIMVAQWLLQNDG